MKLHYHLLIITASLSISHLSLVAQPSMIISEKKVCPNTNVEFKAEPTGYTYQWVIDGDTISTDQAFDSVFVKTGNYPIQLNFYIEAELDTTIYDEVEVSEEKLENPELMVYTKFACPEEKVGFGIIASNDYEYDVRWNFGDGSGATITFPYHKYSDLGTYMINLEIINDCGIDTVLHDSVRIVDSLPIEVIGLGMTDKEVCPNRLVEFGLLSYNNKDQYDYYWDFGDGNYSRQIGPQHLYTTEGVYPITLEVQNGCGSSATLTDTIKVSSQIPVSIDMDNSLLYYYMEEACPGQQLEFFALDNMQRNPYYYTFHWDFGDGKTSSLLQPVHVYNDAGDYVVSFTLTNECGNYKTYYDTIKIRDNLPVTGNSMETFFNILNNPVCPNDTAILIANKEMSMYEWKFTDSVTSNEKEFHYSNSLPGKYPFSLKLGNLCGSDTVLYDTIEVREDIDINAHIYNTSHVCPDDLLSISAIINGSNNIEWNMGDGTKYYSKNINHQYKTDGIYPISLKLTNGCGKDTIINDSVLVGGKKIENPSYSYLNYNEYNTGICPEDSITGLFFSFLSGYKIKSLVTEEDGFIDIKEISNGYYEIKYAYSKIGNYKQYIELTNNCGESIIDSFFYGEYTDVVKIRENSPIYSGQITYSYSQKLKYFESDTNPTTQTDIWFEFSQGFKTGEWDFGDGSPVLKVDKQNKKAVHRYEKPGHYMVKGTFTNSCGYTETFYETLSIDSAEVSSNLELTTGMLGLKLYPNPSADGVFKLSLDERAAPGPVNIEVSDINGRLISMKKYKNSHGFYKIDLSGYASGVYVIKAEGKGFVSVNKAIKK